MTIWIPGSKSYTNRALVMAALTRGSVVLKDPLYSADTEAMIGCLRSLGVEIAIGQKKIVVHGDIWSLEKNAYELFAHDSGTSARFLLALLCLIPGVKTLRGCKRLQERPISDLVDALRSIGAEIDYCEEEGKLPVTVRSSILPLSLVVLRAEMSSQFCSALLLIAPYVGLTIHLAGKLVSKPYIDMTLACMLDWGVEVVQEGTGCYVISGGQNYSKKEYTIEGDYSSAGYFFALAVLTRSKIRVGNLNPRSMQADRRFLDILVQMGNGVFYGDNCVEVEGRAVSPLQVNMEDCPDQVMTLAVLAAFAQGMTHITGVRSLRVKETDRVLALRTELAKMGIQTEESHDSITIYGGNPHAAQIETYNDHRIAMAFAVAAALLPGMTIYNPEVVNKTFPTFWEMMRQVI